MIVAMKKYSFLVYHGIYENFLKQLQELGVLHVLEKQQGSIENPLLSECLEESKRVKVILKYLNTLFSDEQKKRLAPVDEKADASQILSSLECLVAEKNELLLKKQALRKEYESFSIWGDFDLRTLERLAESGCKAFFYVCPKSAYRPEWEEEYHAVEIAEQSSMLYFVLFSLNGKVPEVEADMVKLPKYSLSEMERELHKMETRIDDIQRELSRRAESDWNTLKRLESDLRDRFSFSKVMLCETEKAAEDKVMLLEGFVPEDKEAELQKLLEESNVYYQAEKPHLEEKIPIKLKNNRFARLYEPITKMYSLPNYSEIDPTPFLAPFFMLFFGLCLGDGGYGLLIFLACLLLKKKMGKELRPILLLGETLGLSTLFVGIVTGSFFGVALESMEWTWLKDIKHYFLTQNNYGRYVAGYNPMMVLALIIGVIQILYAMGIQVAKITIQYGFKYAASKLGWLVLLVSLILSFGLPALGLTLPTFVLYAVYGLMGICLLLIFFYNSPGKNILLNFGAGLWHTYNMASGLLGDILSYVRLFALGLTGSILGSVFNTMAFGMTEGLPVYVRWLVVLLILLVGHGLNFALSMIGALVHPLRLTFVEFYKNEGFEGGGKSYNPFSFSSKKKE